MADKQEGPPTKRAKISSPSHTSKDGELNLNFLDDLPDELGTLSTSDVQANGTGDQGLVQTSEENILSNQHLSQLLSVTSSTSNTSNSVSHLQGALGQPSHPGSLANNFTNVSKSLLSNSLASSPNIIGNKVGVTTSVPGLGNDLLSSVTFSSGGLTSSSITVGNITNSLATNNKPTLLGGPMNSVGNPAVNQSQFMNGPHKGMGGLAAMTRSITNTTQVSNFQGTFTQANILPNSVGNTVMSATSGPAPISSQPNMVHTGAMNATSQPQLMKTGQTGQPATGGVQHPVADPEKRKLIQQQLVLLLHAHKCQRREQTTNGENRPCNLPHCRTMKNVLNHMTTCNAGKSCLVAHCASSRQIITHWKNCTRNDCPVCLPLKVVDKRNPGVKTMQTGTPAQSQKQPVPEELARAYQSLGLPAPSASQSGPLAQNQFGVHGPLQNSGAASAAGSLNQLGQQSLAGVLGNTSQSQPVPAQPSNTLSSQLAQLGVPNLNPASAAVSGHNAGIASTVASLVSGPSGPTDPSMTAVPNRQIKEWHQSVTQDLRNHLVHKLVQAIFPTQDPVTWRDRRMNNLVQYARKVEGDMYETANSREEYYHLLAEKIYKIQKELEEKRRSRIEAQAKIPGTGVHPRGPPPQVVRQPTQNGPLRQTGVLPGQQLTGPNSLATPDLYSQNASTLVRPDMTNNLLRQPAPATTISQMPNATVPAQVNVSPALRESQQQLDEALKKEIDKTVLQQAIPATSTQNRPPSAAMLATQRPQQKHSVSQPNHLPQISQPPQSLDIANTTVSQQPTQNNGPCVLPSEQPAQNIKQEPVEQNTFGKNVSSGKEGKDMDVKQENSMDKFDSSTNDSWASKGGKGGKGNMVTSIDNGMDVKPVIKSESQVDGHSVQMDSTVGVKSEVEDNKDGIIKTEADGDASKKTDTDMKPGVPSLGAGAVNTEAMDTTSSTTTNAIALSKPNKKVWKPDELRQVLMSTLEKLYRQEPDSLPFRQPVDAMLLHIPDYYDIVKKPMDLSTIKRKLDTGQYADPWEYVDDVWLMFDNAWLYNRKTSRVYKYCSNLAKVFESEIDGVMQSLGYCCGRKYVFNPQVLCCYGKQLCTIPRDSVYYSYQNRYIYCEKCFNDIKGDEVELNDDPTQPPTKIKKELFVKEKNDKLDYEPFVECQDCGRKLHQICVLHMDQIWPQGFTCDNCLKAKGMRRKENKYNAKRLPTTKLGTYLENRVNSFLKKKDAGAGEVTIRVLSSSDKLVEIKNGMRSRYVETGEMPETFPYRAKAMFAFEEINGVDVCFFGMHVQEYGSDCSPPNARRVYIAYLDSVHFFQPRTFRTHVYHEMLIGYLDYVKSLGYTMAHIWACPPSEGDDYIFHCHPPEQKIPKPKRLQDWYKKMLDKAIIERVVIDYKDILKDAVENNLQSATEMPYFEGDFWPNVMEESIKELDQEEEKRKREEAEAAAAEADDNIGEGPEGVEGPAGMGKKKGQKSGQKKKHSKSKNNNKKNNKKTTLPLGGNDLSAKLYSHMEKHKEVFFVIRLHPANKVDQLMPIHDPDPLISCDLMDGRDAFLTMAREKHYEFSSLRRAMFSSMALLYELHNQGKDAFVYTCNSCKAHVETRYHCRECDDFDLCVQCYHKENHPHKMEKLGFELDEPGNDSDKPQNPQEARRLSIQRCIQSLVHACSCKDANCRLPSCQKMKRVVTHTRQCKRKTNAGCPVCKQLIALCCYHAKHCQETKCMVPFCQNIKQKLAQQQTKLRLMQNQTMRRRMATMARSSGLSASMSAQSVTSSSSSTPPAITDGKIDGKPAQAPPTGAIAAAKQAEQAARIQATTQYPGVAASQTPVQQQPAQVQNTTQQLQQPSPHLGTQSTMQPGNPLQHDRMNNPNMQSSQPMGVDVNHQLNMLPSIDGRQRWPVPPQQQLPRMGMQQPQQPNMPVGNIQVPSGSFLGGVVQQNRNSIPPAALQQLLQALKSPSSPQQQQQLLNILKSHPQLMAAFISRQRQQDAKAGAGQPGAQQNVMQGPGNGGPGPQAPGGMQPHNPQVSQSQSSQHQQQQQWFQQQQYRHRLQQQQQQQQQQQRQQVPGMHQQFQQPQAPPYNVMQRPRMNFPPGQNFVQGDGSGGGMMSQYSQQHQLMHVQQQQAQLKQQMVGGQPMSPQHMLAAAQQQASQSPLHQVRSPPSSLPTTVRSPQPTPSPRQHTPNNNPVPSPRAHPIPSPQIAQTHSPHPAITGQLAAPPPTSNTSDPNPLNTDRVMLTSQSNQDFPGLQQQDVVTPLTPQDQLSRFVDNL